jgi:hypothetical protein
LTSHYIGRNVTFIGSGLGGDQRVSQFPDFIADTERQSSRRYKAMVRKLDGTVLWLGDRIHQTKTAAQIEASVEYLRRKEGASA